MAGVVYAPLGISQVAVDKTMTIKNSVITAVTNSATAANLENCAGFGESLPGQFNYQKKVWFKKPINLEETSLSTTYTRVYTVKAAHLSALIDTLDIPVWDLPHYRPKLAAISLRT